MTPVDLLLIDSENVRIYYHKDTNDINEIKRTLNVVLDKVNNIENVLKEHNRNEFLNIIKNKVPKVKNISNPSPYSPLLSSNSENDIDDDDDFIRKNLQHKK